MISSTEYPSSENILDKVQRKSQLMFHPMFVFPFRGDRYLYYSIANIRNTNEINSSNEKFHRRIWKTIESIQPNDSIVDFFFTNADEYINKLVLRFFTIIDDK